MDIKTIQIKDYFYDLPDERIAKYPLANRDQSQLLIYNQGEIKSKHFHNIDEYLPEGSLLVRNNSKVIHARLLFRKETGAVVEIFCLEPVSPNSYELSLSSRQSCQWQCMLGNARRWKVGNTLHREIEGQAGKLSLVAERVGQNEIKFSWDNEAYTFGELLELMGVLPIPPYLNRETEEGDKQTYQTVYAKEEGSVAAPTAGLHFTPQVFEQLEKKGIKALDVTLHVGAGTFKPVKSEAIGEHEMHRELIELSFTAIERLLTKIDNIVAVGTTSVRTLESLYWFGVMIKRGLVGDELCVIPQWLAYEEEETMTAKESLMLILDYLRERQEEKLIFATSIFIVPTYQFRIVKAIVTNFHQPHSTLLLLISAFIGDDWHKVYDYAMTHDYRFLSYGDSSLLMP